MVVIGLEARIAIGFATARTDLHAAIAQQPIAAAARADTADAERFVTRLAKNDAIETSIHIAIGAAVASFVTDDFVTAATHNPIPFVKANVSRTGVVGLQDTANQNEAITDSSIE